MTTLTAGTPSVAAVGELRADSRISPDLFAGAPSEARAGSKEASACNAIYPDGKTARGRYCSVQASPNLDHTEQYPPLTILPGMLLIDIWAPNFFHEAWFAVSH